MSSRQMRAVRLRDALEEGPHGAAAAAEFRRMAADEDVRLDRPHGSRGTLRFPAQQRWADPADVEAVLCT